MIHWLPWSYRTEAIRPLCLTCFEWVATEDWANEDRLTFCFFPGWPNEKRECDIVSGTSIENASANEPASSPPFSIEWERGKKSTAPLRSRAVMLYSTDTKLILVSNSAASLWFAQQLGGAFVIGRERERGGAKFSTIYQHWPVGVNWTSPDHSSGGNHRRRCRRSAVSDPRICDSAWSAQFGNKLREASVLKVHAVLPCVILAHFRSVRISNNSPNLRRWF